MKVIFFVGAGISKSAGIPTYRDTAGLWNVNDMKTICVKGREYDTESYIFYNKFRKLLSNVSPSNVHYTLKEIQDTLGYNRCKIYSQNIDDLLERVGCIVEKVHGDACKSRCESCGKIDNIGYNSIDEKSKCINCSNKLRNNVVYYGEKANYENMLSDIIDLEKNDILFMIGTSNSSINIDMIIRPLKMKKVYINIMKEDRYNLEQYDIIIYEEIEKCLDKIKRIINENIKDI